MYNKQSDFCYLDPEVVANHYDAAQIEKPDDTTLDYWLCRDWHEYRNIYAKKVSKRLWASENTAPGPDGIPIIN